MSGSSLGKPRASEKTGKSLMRMGRLALPEKEGMECEIDYGKIPEACDDLATALRAAGFPMPCLMAEVVSDSNISDSFDYIVSHLESREQREHYWPKKAVVTARLKADLVSGAFRITPDVVRTIEVTDGPKRRLVQSPRVYYRIGCHAVMVIVEKYVHPTLIANTAASIKGRGMHWLFHRIEEDCRRHPELTRYFLANDIEKYYDSISQEQMRRTVRQYVCDPMLLPMLDNFISILPKGLSKGLRSSQCFANLLLSPIDHKMCALAPSYVGGDGITRYMYQRYMDDVRMRAGDKRTLWRLADIYHREIAKLGLRVKASEAVRPLTEGDDYLGFVNFGTHSRIRKRTKRKAARRLAEVKSRRRRREIIGSFKGMACHADCKHLYYTLTHHHMRKFNELGVTYQPDDGKKRFPGKVVQIRSIINKTVEIHDYESDLKTVHGDGRYLVSFRDAADGTWAKFFTASKEMQNILDQISDIEEGFPFETVITMEVHDGKSIPKFT